MGLICIMEEKQGMVAMVLPKGFNGGLKWFSLRKKMIRFPIRCGFVKRMGVWQIVMILLKLNKKNAIYEFNGTANQTINLLKKLILQNNKSNI